MYLYNVKQIKNKIMFKLSTLINGNEKRFTVVLNGNVVVSQFKTLSEAANDLISRNNG